MKTEDHDLLIAAAANLEEARQGVNDTTKRVVELERELSKARTAQVAANDDYERSVKSLLKVANGSKP